MKRRLTETESAAEVKPEPEDAADTRGSDLQQTVAELVAQQVATAILAPLTGGSSAPFGRVAFGQEQQSVNAFLRQKLGKDSLARRPGPGGRKLTYIESCKAIELANRAFGFNGWSCHIVECKEEYKEKKGDRWSIAYSSLVRIELKDGTSHEDVGFGTSDGQRDLGAALEQAKKASISDARKRALRLFGEYLGNSCYDREHIKDVNSNKPMAPLAAAPNVILPGQQQGQSAATNGRPPVVDGQVPQPQQNQHAQAQEQVQTMQQGQQVQQPPRQQTAPMQPVQQQQQHQQAKQPQQHQPQQQQQQRPHMPQQAKPPQQQQQWKPPQVLRNGTATNNATSSMQQQAHTNCTATSRTSMMQGTASSTSHGSSTTAPVSNSAASTSPFRPKPQQWVSSNAPPPPRMMTLSYPPSIVKTERPLTVQAQPKVQFDIEDLSLSQFDYDPNAENSNPVKRMRS